MISIKNKSPKAAQGFFLKLPWAARGRPRLFPTKSLGQSLVKWDRWRLRVSLGHARSPQGSCPRHIMSPEFGPLWGSLVPLGNTRPHFCSAQGRAQGFRRGSERLFIFRKNQSRGKTAIQGSPKAYSRPPPKAHRPRPAQGFAQGSAQGSLAQGKPWASLGQPEIIFSKI